MDPKYPYTCLKQGDLLLGLGIVSTLTDAFATLLPASIVINLQMPNRQKIAVTSVFMVGITVNICSILRIYYVSVRAKDGDSWNYYTTLLPGIFEMGLGNVRYPIPLTAWNATDKLIGLALYQPSRYEIPLHTLQESVLYRPILSQI